MPGFWKFMWRCTPFTYLVEGQLFGRDHGKNDASRDDHRRYF